MRRTLAGAAVALVFLGVACGPLDREEDVPERPIREVRDDHAPTWMELPEVVGVGIGECEGEPCIRVHVTAASPEVEEAIPDSIEGHPVRTEVTEPFRPRPPSDPDPSDPGTGA